MGVTMEISQGLEERATQRKRMTAAASNALPILELGSLLTVSGVVPAARVNARQRKDVASWLCLTEADGRHDTQWTCISHPDRGGAVFAVDYTPRSGCRPFKLVFRLPENRAFLGQIAETGALAITVSPIRSTSALPRRVPPSGRVMYWNGGAELLQALRRFEERDTA